MLTIDELVRSLEIREQYGIGHGACFGTFFPDRLRPTTPVRPLPPAGKGSVKISSCRYILRWWDENGEPKDESFRVKNGGLAVIKAMRFLGIKGKLTKRKLLKAGAGKEVSLIPLFSGGQNLLKPKH